MRAVRSAGGADCPGLIPMNHFPALSRQRCLWLALVVFALPGGCLSDSSFQPILVENLATTTALIARQLTAVALNALFP